MDPFIIGLQLLLAGVFGVAGVAKLFDLPGSRRAMVDFGVPERAAPLAGLLLPLAELATAVALVLNPIDRWGAIAALTLLLVFSLGIVSALVRGRAPDCHCFGQVHSAPAGPWTLARNGMLAVFASILVVHGPGTAIDDWVAARSGAELVAIGATLMALALAAFSFRQWSENRKLRQDLTETLATVGPSEPKRWPKGKPEGLPVGTMAPDFALIDMHGETRTLESLRARGRPVVLEFVSPTCGPCASLLPTLARWQSALAERVTIAVVTSGGLENPLWEELGVSDVLLDDSDEVFNAFRIPGTPKAIAVDVDGRVAAAPAGGGLMPEALIRLMINGGGDDRVAATAPAFPTELRAESGTT